VAEPPAGVQIPPEHHRAHRPCLSADPDPRCRLPQSSGPPAARSAARGGQHVAGCGQHPDRHGSGTL